MLNKSIIFAVLLLAASQNALAREITAKRGDAFLVSAQSAKITGEAWAEFGERVFPLRKTEDGAAGIAAVERETVAGPKELVIYGGSRQKPVKIEELTVRVEDRKFPEQRLKVDESKVTLSKEDLERALREKEIISKAIGLRSREEIDLAEWAKPLEGVESSPYGLDRYYNGKKGSFHSGIDIASPSGTPVKAASKGRVALTGDFFYTGNTVFVDHGYGVITAYFHMSAISVKDGEEVMRGQEVGKVGSTGRSTGAHLHWSLYVSGVKADPNSIFDINAIR